jgi:rhodanese-related sulfurtransferase
LTQIHLDQYHAALESLNKAIASNPDDSWTQLYLATTYGLLNFKEKAREAFRLANQLRAGDGWGPVTLVATAHKRFRWYGDRDKLKRGLSAAGVTTGGEWFKLITYSVVGKPNVVEGVTSINTTEAKELHDSGAVFVDTQATWFTGHIPGAHFLEWWGEGWLFNEAALRRIAGPESEIVIYSLGKKSKSTSQAAALAVSRGFKNIYLYSGGLDDWKAAGYPVELPN